MPKRPISFALLLCAAAPAIAADIEVDPTDLAALRRSEGSGSAFIDPDSKVNSRTAFELRYTYGLDSDIDGGFGGEIGVQDIYFSAPIPIYHRDGFRIFSGVKYKYSQVDFSGPVPFADLDAHRVTLPVNVLHEKGSWLWWAHAAPSYAGDFDDFDADGVAVSGMISAAYSVNQHLKLAAGLYYQYRHGDDLFVPGVGIIWTPIPELEIRLTPPRPQIAYAPSEDWLITLFADPAGEMWHVSGDRAFGSAYNLKFRDIQFGLSVERRIAGPVWGFVSGGIGLFRNVEALDGGENVLFEEDADPAPFFQIGIRGRF